MPGPLGSEPFYAWVSEKIEIVAFRDGDRVRVFRSICPHMGARLEVDRTRNCLHCPWHGLAFDLASRQSDHHRYRSVREWRGVVEGNRLLVFDGGPEPAR